MSQATMSLSVPPAAPAAASVDEAALSHEGYQELVIRPRRGWIGVDWGEMLRFRELLYFLVWRDVKVKYKQAVFGAMWAIAVPIVSVIIYSFIGTFAGFANRTMAGVPYLVWVYSGVLPWVFLQNSINGGGMSLVNNQALMSKVYLPRLFIPLSTIGGALVDMALSGSVFVCVVLFYILKTSVDHTPGWFCPSWQIVFIPFLMILLVVAAMGITFLLSALTVMYRDLRFIVPFITQLGIWLTCVAIPQTIFVKYVTVNGVVQLDEAGQKLIAHDYRPWLALNPLAGIIQAFRSAILGDQWQWLQLGTSVIFCFSLLVFGLFYFKRVERRFADIA